jgi:hypothetical protein
LRMFRDRGVDEGRLGVLRTSLNAGEGDALARVKVGGLVKLLLISPQKSAPFDRFENSAGATFSALSTSSTSEALRLTGEAAIAFCLFLTLAKLLSRAPSTGANGWRVRVAMAGDGSVVLM